MKSSFDGASGRSCIPLKLRDPHTESVATYLDLAQLANGDAAWRAKAERASIVPLKQDFEDLRQALNAQPITRETLPQDLLHDWVTQDGRERVEAVPKGDPNDSETLRRFADAVLVAEPNATGQAINTVEWGRTIFKAFIQAGGWALLSSALLLWIVLRRFSDVMLTLIPLLACSLRGKSELSTERFSACGGQSPRISFI